MAEKNGEKKQLLRIGRVAPYTVVLFLIVLGFLGGGWFRRTPQLFEATEFLMDTAVTIKVFAFSEREGKDLLRKAFDEAARIEHIMEPLKGNGELQHINAAPGTDWHEISPDLKTVLERSRYYYDLTDGAFDPTIAAVKWLWNFEEGSDVPPKREIQEKLRSVGFTNIEMDGNRIRFTNPDTQLDLGGVAKGYAIDRMVAVLKKNGAKAALVNGGGEIATIGEKPGKIPWEIGVNHPRLSRTIRVGHMPLPTVATSGDYQRFFMKDGVRYHHILVPSTGYPANGCISVTVWAANATDADILSTSIFVLGHEKGLAFAERLKDVETLIFYEQDGVVKTVMTSGVRDKVRL